MEDAANGGGAKTATAAPIFIRPSRGLVSLIAVAAILAGGLGGILSGSIVAVVKARMQERLFVEAMAEMHPKGRQQPAAAVGAPQIPGILEQGRRQPNALQALGSAGPEDLARLKAEIDGVRKNSAEVAADSTALKARILDLEHDVNRMAHLLADAVDPSATGTPPTAAVREIQKQNAADERTLEDAVKHPEGPPAGGGTGAGTNAQAAPPPWLKP